MGSDVIPYRQFWILSQPRLGKLGAGRVCLREGRGSGRSPCSDERTLVEAQSRGGPLLEGRAAPRLEGEFHKGYTLVFLYRLPGWACWGPGVSLRSLPHLCLTPAFLQLPPGWNPGSCLILAANLNF